MDPISGHTIDLGTFLCYVVPIKNTGEWLMGYLIFCLLTCTDSSVISLFPDAPEYPKFYNFGQVLHQMVRSNIKIHPFTREMLSTLDQ